MKRIRPRTDIPNWRDPQMPVLREYKMGDGSQRTVIDPDYEQRYREMLISTSSEVGWRNDPLYERKRKWKKM
jgi:hypothetical protein